MNSIKKSEFLIFSGYAATGGSAVRDLLYNCDEINIFNNEFRLVNDHYGLYSLYKSIFFPYDLVASSLAVKDFMWLTSKMSKPYSVVNGMGLGLDNKTNNKFSISTKKFLKDIIVYDYPIDFYIEDFKKSPLKYFVKKIRKKLFFKNSEIDKGFMTIFESEEFIKATKFYLESIFEKAFKKQKKFIGLHNAINIQDINVVRTSLSFYNNAKLIIVDRDPRDIFFDFPYQRFLPDKKNKISRVDAFIQLYQNLRKDKIEISKLNNVLIINFEDLCFNTTNIIKKIENFLELRNKIVLNSNFLYFESRKNVGIWKSNYNKCREDINKIEKALLKK